MTKPAKIQRREDARAQALRLRQEQERAAKRQRLIAIVLLVVGLVVVGGVVTFIILSQPDPPPDFSESEDPLSEVVSPATANEDGGIVVGASGVAGDVEGTEDALVVTVYSDFMCPVCGFFEQAQGPVLERLAAAGDIVVEHRPVAILDHTSAGTRFSTRAVAAVALVADESPETFKAYHDVLFANQPSEGSTGHSDEQLAAFALEAGVPQDLVDAIEDGSYMEGEDSFSLWATAATEQATRDFEQFGTPTILVDGENITDLGVDWRNEGELEAAIVQARG